MSHEVLQTPIPTTIKGPQATELVEPNGLLPLTPFVFLPTKLFYTGVSYLQISFGKS